MMTNPAQIEYNGLILLHAYLQRFYVNENTQLLLGYTTDNTNLKRVKDFMDEVNLMITMFEDTKELATTQYARLVKIQEDVLETLNNYFKDDDDFRYKVALVASALYGERSMNAHIIRLGQLFDVEVGPDFEKRIPFYVERTKAMNAVVHMMRQDEALPEKMIETIELWYGGMEKQRDKVIGDAQKIKPMLSVRHGKYA